VGTCGWDAVLTKKPERFALRFGRDMMALDAAAQDLGVALESTVKGSSYLESGRLIRVFNPAWHIQVGEPKIAGDESRGNSL